ncbi:MAG: peptide deformylase [Defluviitaleaceae bacterium]|nr:peptide deformylase [Defluviitaleaceae bacterium]
MPIRNLTPFHDPLFRKTSKPVVKFDDRLFALLDDMHDTLKRANGYGCAAVHVGILRRVVIVHDASGIIELINPTITKTSTATQRVQEGSIAPGAPRGHVLRPTHVTVTAQDRHGNPIIITSEGFLAATLCHEIDHLDGILFSDKLI